MRERERETERLFQYNVSFSSLMSSQLFNLNFKVFSVIENPHVFAIRTHWPSNHGMPHRPQCIDSNEADLESPHPSSIDRRLYTRSKYDYPGSR